MEVLRMSSSVSNLSLCSSSPLSHPVWRPDAVSDECLGCGKAFSFLYRRHHCRACGELVCAACSPSTAIVPHVGADRPVRVCKSCSSGCLHYASGSDGSSDSDPSEGDADIGMDIEIDDDLVPWAVEVLAAHSTAKESAMCYDYFVRSEAVSWLVDAGIVPKRRAAAALFARLVEEDYVVIKPWSGRQRTAFYRLNDGKCADHSQHGSTIFAQTNKCRNCQQSYREAWTPAPGFCSIDCKTSAVVSQADNARAKQLL